MQSPSVGDYRWHRHSWRRWSGRDWATATYSLFPTRLSQPQEWATYPELPMPKRQRLLARAGDVHGERTVLKLVTMKFFNGLLGLLGATHRHEGKTARATGKLVEDDLNDADGANLAEQGFKILRGAGEGEVPHVELGVF